MILDLRSDTVTRPTPEMLDEMLHAKLGDDVFGEDPTVNELQQFAAEMFGKEAALFCPSGTMANQIAIKVLTQPGDEVICEAGAHIHYYEGGGIAFISSASTRPLVGDRGVFTAEQVLEALRPDNIHFPHTSLVCIENTCNRGGGKVFPFSEILKIREVCGQRGLKLHLDGARLFHAMAEDGTDPRKMGEAFHTVSICLSKGLGAPVGSLLLGDSSTIGQALRIRKVLGGGMRQAGVLAAAGLFALKNNVEKLKDDHVLAKQVQTVLRNCRYVAGVLEVETNIVVFALNPEVNILHFLGHLHQHHVLALPVGSQYVRFVTHLDLPTNSLSVLQNVLSSYSPS